MTEQADKKTCQASKTWGEAVVCMRCALAWDPEDPQRPDCKPLTLPRMSEAFLVEAQKIEDGQVAAKHAGFREFSSHEELERAQLLRAGARLVAKILSDDVLRSRLSPKAKPKDKPAQ